jgi:lysylphosphatidylglycerol synthetase-like protein (DUF2156 family)
VPDNQPFRNEREASAAARSVIPPEPGWSILSQPQHADLLHRALEAAGVEVSEFESRTAWWLSGWEDYTVSIIARWIAKAAEPAPGTEIEWAVRIARSNDVTSYDEGTARQLMAMLGENGTPAVLYRREVGPWLAVAEPAAGEGADDG